MLALDEFNRLPPLEAGELIKECCASDRWAKHMTATRPFASIAQLTDAADRHWRALATRDHLQAFRAHPRIGNLDGLNGAPAEEQAGVARASPDVLQSLARHNAQYERKFGFVFLVCASGKSAEDMLRLLRARLGNSRDEELANAAEQQRQITRLRLRKLFA